MKIKFDQAADALYIQLTEGKIEKTEEIEHGMISDYLISHKVQQSPLTLAGEG